MNSDNAYHHSVQNLLTFSSAVKQIKIRISRTIILPVALYEGKICSLTLKQELGLRVFEMSVLRKIFGLKWDVVTK
jgi:hypothetical protein